MRNRFYALMLCGALACSDDGERGSYDIAQSPATGLDDGGDPRQVPTRPADSGASGSIPNRGTHGGPTGLDASVKDATVRDAEVSTDGGGQFACTTSNDCVLRSLTNCCGSYPRCASANAVFTPPDCSGGNVSSCVFPPIDSCACDFGQCVSLSAGVRVTF
jgi:hypothetical protein